MPPKLRRAWKKKETDRWEPAAPRPSNAEEALARELDSCRRALEQGNLGAMLEALRLCAEPNKTGQWAEGARPLPKWLARELDQLIRERLRRRGRNGRSWLDQYKQDMIDDVRYDTVQEARDHGVRWEDAHDIASELLSGTIAEGSADTIARAYKRVKTRSKTAALRYKQLRMIRLDPKLLEQNLLPKFHARLWKRINSLRTQRK